MRPVDVDTDWPYSLVSWMLGLDGGYSTSGSISVLSLVPADEAIDAENEVKACELADTAATESDTLDAVLLATFFSNTVGISHTAFTDAILTLRSSVAGEVGDEDIPVVLAADELGIGMGFGGSPMFLASELSSVARLSSNLNSNLMSEESSS